MNRPGVALAALVLFAAPAFADVTVTMSLSVSGPMAVNGTVTSSLKGTKIRSDMKGMGQDASILIDAATRQQWMVNHATRQFEPLDPQVAMAGLPIVLGEPKVSVTATGQTKEILGRVCLGINVDVTMPVTINGETLTMKLTGPAWVAKDGPGAAEFMAAQKVFADAGLSMSFLAQGPQAKATAELSKAITGLTMEQELRTTIEGKGQMAQLLGQVGNTTIAIKASAISIDPIPDSKFVLPEGYTKK